VHQLQKPISLEKLLWTVEVEGHLATETSEHTYHTIPTTSAWSPTDLRVRLRVRLVPLASAAVSENDFVGAESISIGIALGAFCSKVITIASVGCATTDIMSGSGGCGASAGVAGVITAVSPLKVERLLAILEAAITV